MRLGCDEERRASDYNSIRTKIRFLAAISKDYKKTDIREDFGSSLLLINISF